VRCVTGRSSTARALGANADYRTGNLSAASKLGLCPSAILPLSPPRSSSTYLPPLSQSNFVLQPRVQRAVASTTMPSRRILVSLRCVFINLELCNHIRLGNRSLRLGLAEVTTPSNLRHCPRVLVRACHRCSGALFDAPRARPQLRHYLP
jgi:hypothetical protein